MSPLKPLRADAQRNRDQLVAVAQAVFVELGTQAPLDEIARRARIGNATLYRHFPTRDDLIVAVYAEEVAELCAVDDSVDVFDWLERFVRHVAEKGDLARSLEPSARRSELHEEWHAAMVETVGRLVGQAQRDGRLRADVDPLDLLVMAAGMATAEPARVKRMLQMLRRGAGASSPDQ
ncbi:TetR/AcrR family transcriptional regulator [Kribbella capetownensis]|uniref:TetR/AcrR family transcriptional regulator n=1 Tax=Kribbella capetownensis TaxID=1572659 RepID=A0A4R0JTX2_9ACTN|nr:TetR/AcrR family transcriptional regulator [Kribbella capetownensis]TCC45625.1 TetR/AcrR family transcriptional regulator [Kribbella capetownensis]